MGIDGRNWLRLAVRLLSRSMSGCRHVADCPLRVRFGRGISEQVASRAFERMAIARVFEVELSFDPATRVVSDCSLIVEFA